MVKGERYRAGPAVAHRDRVVRRPAHAAPPSSTGAVDAEARRQRPGWRQWPLVTPSRAAAAPRDRQGDPRRRAAVAARVLGLRRPRRGRVAAVRRAAARRAGRAARSILILVDPAARLLEIVTGADVAPDPQRRRGRAGRLDDADAVRRRRPGRRPHAAASSMLAEHARRPHARTATGHRHAMNRLTSRPRAPNRQRRWRSGGVRPGVAAWAARARAMSARPSRT